MEKFGQAFQAEATELLEELEHQLIELSETPEDQELVDAVFRAMHTIKGSAAMFGFDDISSFTHVLENAFDLVRSGELAVSKELIEISLQARDHLRDLLALSGTDEVPDTEHGAAILQRLSELLPDANTDPAAAEAADQTTGQESEASASLKTYRIRFKPHNDIFLSGTNPVNLLMEVESLGNSLIIAHTNDIPELENYDPDMCYLCWDILLTTQHDLDTVRDIFIFVEDKCELSIEVIDEDGHFTDENDYKKIGEILVARGDIAKEDLQAEIAKQSRLGDILVKSGKVDRSKVESAIVEQNVVRQARTTRQQQQLSSSIRVASEKLDSLVDLVGELVVVQARLRQAVGAEDAAELLAVTEEIERLVGEIRENTMNIRMLPIGTTFSKFKRLVYDLSKDLRKEVELVTEGAETELDKTVIEKLNDPLVHLIRNSIDHGIEAPEVREAAGKPRQGKVQLKAIHSGAHVLIQIIDNGAGLNRESIYKKAVDKGLIAQGTDISDNDLFLQILSPGFSTAKEITSVSGRGVGMDVVKRCIDELKGTISISSKENEGTEITIKLPLTLAIIEGLQVEAGKESYVMPLSVVEECIELTKDTVARANGRSIVNVRDEVVPYIRLREWFEIPGDRPDIEQVVIVNVNAQRVGLAVDHVIGQHQTVVKSLGKVYKNVQGLSGATIRGDGMVALILDVPKLVENVERFEISQHDVQLI